MSSDTHCKNDGLRQVSTVINIVNLAKFLWVFLIQRLTANLISFSPLTAVINLSIFFLFWKVIDINK